MYFEKQDQDCKDGSGIAIDFWTGCPEIKAAILEKLSTFISHFFLLVDISLLVSLLAFFSSYFKTMKDNYIKLQTIFINYDISDVTVSL